MKIWILTLMKSTKIDEYYEHFHWILFDDCALSLVSSFIPYYPLFYFLLLSLFGFPLPFLWYCAYYCLYSSTSCLFLCFLFFRSHYIYGLRHPSTRTIVSHYFCNHNSHSPASYLPHNCFSLFYYVPYVIPLISLLRLMFNDFGFFNSISVVT